jgi:hypothetical protein
MTIKLCNNHYQVIESRDFSTSNCRGQTSDNSDTEMPERVDWFKTRNELVKLTEEDLSS